LTVHEAVINPNKGAISAICCTGGGARLVVLFEAVGGSVESPVFVGSRLKQLRINADLKREEVALAVGIGAHHLGFLENGIRGPSLRSAIALARYFGVPVEDFYEEVDSATA
jgi:DNA-binding XRE family transcriptional regulator